MPTKRNYLIKVIDAKIVDVKRALEAKGIKLESIYEMYKEAQEPETVSVPSSSGQAAATPAGGASGGATTPAASPAGTPSPKTEPGAKNPAESN
jgi:hypothetical protein